MVFYWKAYSNYKYKKCRIVSLTSAIRYIEQNSNDLES